MRNITLASTLVLASVITTAPAFAATQANLPPEHRQHGVAFVSGGVGKQEAMAFKRAAASYPLAVEMLDRVGRRDEFTAGAKVKVLDARGKTMLSTIADGPYLLARLPKGRYTITASYEGKTLHRKVAIGTGGHAPTVLEWKTA